MTPAEEVSGTETIFGVIKAAWRNNLNLWNEYIK